MAERADILDTCSYRFNAVAENALTAALAIQNVNGVLSQVDQFGNVTPLIGGTTPGLTAITGDVVATGPGTVNSTIQPGVVTYAKIQNVSNAVLLGNNSGGAASMQELTAAQARSLLSLVSIATTGSAADLTAGTLPAGRFPALTGDITTVAGSLATTLASNAVTLAKLAQVATNSLLGRSTAGTGNVEVITVGSGLSLSAGTLTATGGGGTITALVGDVTASGSGSVTATIANLAVTTAKIAANAVTLAKMATQADQTILGNVSGGAAVPVALTKVQTLTMLAGSLATGILGVTTTTGALNSNALTSTRVLYSTAANTVGQSAGFTFTAASALLTVGSATVGGEGSLLVNTAAAGVTIGGGKTAGVYARDTNANGQANIACDDYFFGQALIGYSNASIVNDLAVGCANGGVLRLGYGFDRVGAHSDAITIDGGSGAIVITKDVTQSGGAFTANGSVFASGANGGIHVDALGNVRVGKDAALATNATNGFPQMPQATGRFTGTPTTPFTSGAPFGLDLTNNNLQVWNSLGTSWMPFPAFFNTAGAGAQTGVLTNIPAAVVSTTPKWWTFKDAAGVATYIPFFQ